MAEAQDFLVLGLQKYFREATDSYILCEPARHRLEIHDNVVDFC